MNSTTPSQKFELRIKTPTSSERRRLTNPNNKAEAQVARQKISRKEDQLKNAVAWCKVHNVRGHSAVKSGLFPLIKNPRTINKRLDGQVITGHEKSYCSILLPEEEETIVQFAINKNRAYQGINKAELTKLIINILNVRKHLNKTLKGGRKYQPLSAPAKNVLSTKRISRSFWRRWEAKHRNLTLKRQGTISINRALNCTRDMAVKHLDSLAEELSTVGIFTNVQKVEPGVWEGDIDLTRVFNHDETPQFINYGVDGTAQGLVYAGRGESCKQMQRENRESVTVHPFVSFSGEVCICHVIFAGKGISSNMAPKEAVDSIKNLLISSTERGSQDHKSLLDSYKLLDKYLTTNNIQRPVVVLSDGHSSRFDFDVLSFLREHQIRLFFSPPDTTGVTQLLDQVNQKLHLSYKDAKKELFTTQQTINREGFMQILGNMWNGWVSKESIVKAGQRVGISANGLDVNNMQNDKFEQAERVIEKENIPQSSVNFMASPVNLRKNSAAYWKAKFEMSQALIKEASEKSLKLEEIPGLLPISKVKPKKSIKNTRVTQICGSMEGKDVLKVVENLKSQKEEKVSARKQKEKKKQNEKDAFYKCKGKCSCTTSKCLASGLKECTVCRNILRSICSKKSCRKDGRPIMILPACDTNQIVKKKLFDDEGDSDEENEISESET